jgi:hypothetical protein
MHHRDANSFSRNSIWNSPLWASVKEVWILSASNWVLLPVS